ncbi:MAG: M20 family metallopeptidase [Candidatus Hodarchaeota archaeon]
MAFTVIQQFIETTLVNLVRISSENPPGSNIEIVDYIADLAREEGFASKRQKIAESMENIIIAPSEQALTGKKVVLVGHLDTVPVGDNWTKDPFGKDREGDILYGRGTTDMKSGVTAFLAVVKAFQEMDEPLSINPVFIGTADEEVLMSGAKAILSHEDFRDPPEFAVIGEPTGLDLGIAEKGCSHVEIRAKGRAAHGARPELGANAIDACFQIVTQIRKTMPTLTDEMLGTPTVNLGTVKGGTKVNVVPDSCSAELDFRFGPSFSPETIEKIVRTACNTVEEPWKGEYKVLFSIPALGTKKSHPFIQNLSKELEKLGQKPQITGLTYATDAAILIPVWKVPFLIFGPGNQSVLHIADEWVSFKETKTATQVLCNTIIALNK